MKIKQERIFEKIFKIAEIAKYTPAERRNYEESLKHYRDMDNIIDTAFEKGEKKEKRKIGKNLLSMGLKIEEIEKL